MVIVLTGALSIWALTGHNLDIAAVGVMLGAVLLATAEWRRRHRNRQAKGYHAH